MIRTLKKENDYTVRGIYSQRPDRYQPTLHPRHWNKMLSMPDMEDFLLGIPQSNEAFCWVAEIATDAVYTMAYGVLIEL